jgi:hypothetical protein
MTSAARRPRLSGPDARPASGKAAAFWASLRDDLADLISELLALGVGTTVTVPADVERLSAEQASAEIDAMLRDVRALRVTLREAHVAATRADVAALEADRLYERDGEVYRTAAARGSGNLYAKIWDGQGWAYAAGAIRRLRPEHRMTRERAIELSTLFARCIRCGAELTNAVSVERGIGPVCITKI